MTDPRPFHERRRQQFLDEDSYENTVHNQQDLIEGELANIREAAPGTELYSSSYEILYLEAMWLWMLDYTAGCPVENLAPRIAAIVDAFENWNEAAQLRLIELYRRYPEYGAYNYYAPPHFNALADYEDVLQLLSIAILVRDLRSVERIAYVMRSHRGEDGLFDALIAPYDEWEGTEADECVITNPYNELLRAFYVEGDDETLETVKQYLKHWYRAMRNHPRWYDGHVRIGVNGSTTYYGYWAFEAGAAVYLLDIDDSSIDHMVYPKDLVAYGKMLRESGRYTSEGAAAPAYSGRVQGGGACPQTGYWFTPAKENSRGHFQQGELMPIFADSDYGTTIWQWSAEQ